MTVLMVIREILHLRLKMNKGIGKKIESFFRYSVIIRLANLVWLSVYFFRAEVQTCFCMRREFFFNHCIFTDSTYFVYKCNPYIKKSDA
jgi:hypothetical protein